MIIHWVLGMGCYWQMYIHILGCPTTCNNRYRIIPIVEKGLQLNHHHPLGPGDGVHPRVFYQNHFL